MVDVTLYGLKRGQAPPPVPDNLDAPPSDAELSKILGVQKLPSSLGQPSRPSLRAGRSSAEVWPGNEDHQAWQWHRNCSGSYKGDCFLVALSDTCAGEATMRNG